MRTYGLDDSHAEVLCHWIDRLERQYLDPQTDSALEVPYSPSHPIGQELPPGPEFDTRRLLRKGLRRDPDPSAEALIIIIIISILVIVIIVLSEEALLV